MPHNSNFIVSLSGELKNILIATKEIGDRLHAISQNQSEIAFFDTHISNIASACMNISELTETLITNSVDDAAKSDNV